MKNSPSDHPKQRIHPKIQRAANRKKSPDQGLALPRCNFCPVSAGHGRPDRRRADHWRAMQHLASPGCIRDRGYQLHRIHVAQRHGGKGVTGVAAGCLFDPNDPYWNSDDEDL